MGHKALLPVLRLFCRPSSSLSLSANQPAMWIKIASSWVNFRNSFHKIKLQDVQKKNKKKQQQQQTNKHPFQRDNFSAENLRSKSSRWVARLVRSIFLLWSRCAWSCTCGLWWLQSSWVTGTSVKSHLLQLDWWLQVLTTGQTVFGRPELRQLEVFMFVFPTCVGFVNPSLHVRLSDYLFCRWQVTQFSPEKCFASDTSDKKKKSHVQFFV